MSGDGGHEQRKQGEDLQEPVEEEEDQPPQRPRPMTARPRRQSMARTRRTSSSRSSFSEASGAVGGEGTSYTRTLNEQEKRVGGQAQLLLEMFIMDRMRKDGLTPTHRNKVERAVCQEAQHPEEQSTGHEEVYLEDVSSALRDIGDQLSQDYDLNRLIDMVPIQSPKDIFIKVCRQMFQDNQFNWGRVVALFYFAYRLIAKAIVKAVDGIPWIKEIFKWALDFFLQYVAGWIVQRGGWAMIREYWGTSSKTVTALGITAILTVMYVWWKQQ